MNNIMENFKSIVGDCEVDAIELVGVQAIRLADGSVTYERCDNGEKVDIYSLFAHIEGEGVMCFHDFDSDYTVDQVERIAKDVGVILNYPVFCYI